MAKTGESSSGVELRDCMIDEASYRQLHRRARQILRADNRDHGFEPGDLINESLLRILRTGALHQLTDQHHLIALVTIVMRHVLIDYARSVRSLKWQNRVTLDFDVAMPDSFVDALEVRNVLERLAELENGRLHEVVQLRFVCGLRIEEIAAELATSTRTVKRRCRTARTWLDMELRRPVASNTAASAGVAAR